MLGKLLHTLKSEKSSKGAQHQETIADNKQQKVVDYNLISSYKIDVSLAAEAKCRAKQAVNKVRYFVLPNLPHIMNQVLACPISVFHILPHSQRKVKEIDLLKNPYPTYLQFLKPLLEIQIPTYNHLLINDYPAGIGIMPHSDGPAYLPKVFVLSLNSYVIINFQKSYNNGQQQGQYKSRILLEPNSVHIFEEEAYAEYLHGIQNYHIDSMLLFYDETSKQVTKATVDNYRLLQCRDLIEKVIQSGENQKQQGEIRIIKLYDNQQFTHKVQFTRKQRISITIREKYKI